MHCAAILGFTEAGFNTLAKFKHPESQRQQNKITDSKAEFIQFTNSCEILRGPARRSARHCVNVGSYWCDFGQIMAVQV